MKILAAALFALLPSLMFAGDNLDEFRLHERTADEEADLRRLIELVKGGRERMEQARKTSGLDELHRRIGQASYSPSEDVQFIVSARDRKTADAVMAELVTLLTGAETTGAIISVREWRQDRPAEWTALKSLEEEVGDKHRVWLTVGRSPETGRPAVAGPLKEAIEALYGRRQEQEKEITPTRPPS